MNSNQLKERIDWLYSLFCEACSNRSIICWKVLGSNRLFRAAFISSSFCSSSFFRRSASLHRFSCFCLWFWASFSSYLASSLLSWHSCRPSFAICNSFFIFWVWFSCVNSKSSFPSTVTCALTSNRQSDLRASLSLLAKLEFPVHTVPFLSPRILVCPFASSPSRWTDLQGSSEQWGSHRSHRLCGNLVNSLQAVSFSCNNSCRRICCISCSGALQKISSGLKTFYHKPGILLHPRSSFCQFQYH